MPSITELLVTMDYGPAPESDAQAQAWLDARGRSFGHFINGRWAKGPVKGHTTFDTVNPANGQVLAQVSQGTAAQVDQAVQAAQQALPGWQRLGAHGRARHLYAVARALQKHARLLAVLETLDNGKPIRETRDIDVPLAVRHFYHHAGWAQLLDEQFPHHRAIYQEQHGMLFEDLAGERVTHGRDEVACVVVGEVSESTSGEKLQSSVVGQISGGLQPLARRTEFVIDLQLRAATVAVRLTQDAFQYSTLFPGETGSSAVLIRSVLKLIRKALPSAPVYEDFAIAENILSQSADQLVTTNGPSSALTLLSLRSHSEKNVLVQKSTLPAFDLYSSLARHDAMRAQ